MQTDLETTRPAPAPPVLERGEPRSVTQWLSGSGQAIPLFKVRMAPSVLPALEQTLQSGYVGQGPRVDEFEQALAPWCGSRNVLALNSGTSALHLALRLGYGALKLEQDRLLVTECVGNGHRQRGIGRAILGEMATIAKREGRELVAEIWADNRTSIALHERAGLELVETTQKDSLELRRYRLCP